MVFNRRSVDCCVSNANAVCSRGFASLLCYFCIFEHAHLVSDDSKGTDGHMDGYYSGFSQTDYLNVL